MLLILNKKDYSEYLLGKYSEKGEKGYQKMLTKTEKKEFWLEAIRNFYNCKSPLKNLKKVEDIGFDKIFDKWPLYKNKHVRKLDNLGLKASFIENTNNSNDMIYKKIKVPLSYQHYSAYENVNNNCPKTKLTINHHSINSNEYLPQVLNIKDINEKYGNKKNKTIIIVDGGNYNEKDHVITDFNWNDQDNKFEMSSDSGLKYILCPFKNEMKTIKDKDIIDKYNVDEFLSDKGIVYLMK